jgi:kynurenine formamidase
MSTDMERWRIAALLLGALSIGAHAAGEPAVMSKDEFNALVRDNSNRGRWGDQDELGTLNFITADKRKQAANLVRKGITVSLEIELSTKADAWNTAPFGHAVMTAEMAGHQVAGDRYTIDVHGLSFTHMDGLAHFAHQGFFYNGVPYSTATATGVTKLGIQNIGIHGVFTRGVLVDLPRLYGTDYLQPGYAITTEDLDAWERHAGVKIASGDVLLIRTGRWAKAATDGKWNFMQAAAGSHVSLGVWLKKRQVAVLGSDGISDVMPSRVEGLATPLHEFALAALGMPLLDNMDLEPLAEEAARQKRSTFLFVCAPLRIPGGTGSPLNPLAVF